MAIQIYPLQLSPATLNQQYQSEPIMAIGGTAPYTFSILSGNLPLGINADTSATSPNQQLVLAGKALIPDQYTSSGGPAINGPAFVPVIANPSTFVVQARDNLGETATIQYTIPVGVYSEDEAISVFEMLKACYGSDWYIVMSDMGTRNVKIGDIGNAAFGGIRLVINAYLNSQTQGMIRRLRYYIRQFDRLKLLTSVQKNGELAGIKGIDFAFEDKLAKVLENSKTVLPAYTRSEVEARFGHMGGSDFTGSITSSRIDGGGSDSNVRLTR